MSSNQGNQGNKQSDKNAGEKSPPRSGSTADKGNLRPDQQSQQSGNKGSQQQGRQQPGGPQQGGQQQGGQQQQGGGPRGRQSAQQDMDDDTGLSDKANRQSSEADEGSRQSKQSNVGRRDDGTPD